MPSSDNDGQKVANQDQKSSINLASMYLFTQWPPSVLALVLVIVISTIKMKKEKIILHDHPFPTSRIP